MQGYGGVLGLQCQHPLQALVGIPVTLLPIQILANASRKAT